MNFPEGSGGLCHTCVNSEGVGGHQIPAKIMKILGGGGSLVKFPLWWGSGYFLELHNSGHVMFSRELIWLLLFS